MLRQLTTEHQSATGDLRIDGRVCAVFCGSSGEEPFTECPVNRLDSCSLPKKLPTLHDVAAKGCGSSRGVCSMQSAIGEEAGGFSTAF